MVRLVPLTDFESVSAILSQLRIFGGVTDTQRESVFRRLELWRLQEGEFVFHKGDEPSAIYVVKSGQIDIQTDSWLPTTHATYWAKYKNQLEDMGTWYGQTSLEVSVPSYV